MNSPLNESGPGCEPVKGEQAPSAIMMENENLAQVASSIQESINRLFKFRERMLGPENTATGKAEALEPTGGDIGMLGHSVKRIGDMAETIEKLVGSLDRI